MTLLPRHATTGAALFMLLCGCGGPDAPPSSARPTPLADTCRVQLGARPPASIEPPAAAAVAASPTSRRVSSRLVAHVELELASLAKELEGKVATRLAEERNKGIGIAGHLRYTVDRGPFTLAIEGDSLVVRTDVRARAEACRGSSCYATCEPQGRATATVPLRLTPEYRFAPSRVSFAFTRGCEVRALGGMVRIDVTPTIQAQLAPSLRRVEQEIDGKLPPLRPQAERLWAELGKPRSLPLGGCVVMNPRGIVQGPVAGTTPRSLRVRFGLVAHPEIRTRCGEAPAPRSLPPLTQDPALPAVDDLVLALVSPLATAATGLEGAAPFDAGGAQARIARTAVVAAGSLVALDLGLRGEACGDLGMRSTLGWTEDGRALRLVAPAFADGERERALRASLAPDTLVRSLGQVRFPPPVPPDTLQELIPSIASSMSDPSVDVSAKVEAVKPLDVIIRGEDLAASVLLRGSVELKQR